MKHPALTVAALLLFAVPTKADTTPPVLLEVSESFSFFGTSDSISFDWNTASDKVSHIVGPPGFAYEPDSVSFGPGNAIDSFTFTNPNGSFIEMNAFLAIQAQFSIYPQPGSYLVFMHTFCPYGPCPGPQTGFQEVLATVTPFAPQRIGLLERAEFAPAVATPEPDTYVLAASGLCLVCLGLVTAREKTASILHALAG